MMVKMKVAKCVKCGDVMLKVAGKLSKVSFDACSSCRSAERDEQAAELRMQMEAIDANIRGAIASARNIILD